MQTVARNLKRWATGRHGARVLGPAHRAWHWAHLHVAAGGGTGQQGQEALLSGVRILDMTRILAGPTCTQNLGDMGAEVIKIERPQVGDDTRTWGPPFAESTAEEQTRESAYFLSANRNKKSVAVDFSSPKGADVIMDLARQSDVLVENFLPRKLAQYGLDFDSLHEINPSMIYCSITGYGQTGPQSQDPGYAVMVEGAGGLMGATGEADGRPVKSGVAVLDLLTGLHAQSAILAALFARQRTGLGQWVQCSLLESQLASLANVGSNYLIGGDEYGAARRRGTAHESIVPYQAFETSDGAVLVGGANDRLWQRLCAAIERPDLAADSRFTSNPLRVEYREVLLSELEKVFRDKPRAHWIDRLSAHSVPCAPINTIQEAFESPQACARDMKQVVSHPTCGDITLAGFPVKYSNNPCTLRMPPPTLGQHTFEVLQDVLRLDDTMLEGLKRDGVIS